DFHVTGVQTCALPISRLEETITQLSTEKPANDRPKRRFGTKALRRKVSPKSILTRLHVTEDEVFWHMRSALTRTKLLRFVRGARSEERRVGKGGRARG